MEANSVIVRVNKFEAGEPRIMIDQEVITGDQAPSKAVKAVQKMLKGEVPLTWDSGFYRITLLQGYQDKYILIESDEIARWDIELEKRVSVKVLAFEGITEKQ